MRFFLKVFLSMAFMFTANSYIYPLITDNAKMEAEFIEFETAKEEDLQPAKMLLNLPREIFSETFINPALEPGINESLPVISIDSEYSKLNIKLMEDESWRAELDSLKKWVQKEKKRSYSKMLKKIEVYEESFNMRKIKLTDYISKIKYIIDKTRQKITALTIDPIDYPNLTLYLENRALQIYLSRDKIIKESMDFTNRIRGYGSPEEQNLLKDLLWKQKSVPYYSALKSIFEQKDSRIQRQYKNLALYFRYLEKSEKVNEIELLEETARYVYKIKDEIAETQREKDIIFVDRYVTTVDMYMASLVSETLFVEFQENRDRMFEIVDSYYNDADTEKIKESLGIMDALYRLTQKKSDLLFYNIIKEKKQPQKK
ncbi:MAG: hypothetical protein ABH857_02830 [Elusimicrobiota bacterium]